MDRRFFIQGAAVLAGTAATSGLANASVPRFARPDPDFMQNTVMSTKAMLRSWSDQNFQLSLLRDATGILRQIWRDILPTTRFVAHLNSPKISHLPLPHMDRLSIGLSEAELTQALKNEVGDELNCEYYLPAAVIAKATFDTDFRSALLASPNRILTSLGYAIAGRSIVVHENSADEFHLGLFSSPTTPAELDLMERKIEQYAMDGSTKCCATGTNECDDHTQGLPCSTCHGGSRATEETPVRHLFEQDERTMQRRLDLFEYYYEIKSGRKS